MIDCSISIEKSYSFTKSQPLNDIISAKIFHQQPTQIPQMFLGFLNFAYNSTFLYFANPFKRPLKMPLLHLLNMDLLVSKRTEFLKHF